ncbi:hypothetical protein CY35_12G009100 [Sphagnum magellanicum]|nr:hypothetical protein CY35_12G009100 [Sphagnum magellanicum]KAH9544708.1 hypothetical protein CY35_12G009100 [Sphagnum magellanicum]
MAFVAGLEAHLRMISTEATRKYPIVKDAAERAMFKVQLLSSTSDVAGCDDILKTHLLACELKNTKLSISGLVGMEKLIAHDAVLPSALPSVLATLKEDQVMYAGSLTNDQSAMCIKQLKTLQTALTILQSQLHPTDEDQMSIILGLCLRLLGNSRNPDSVWRNCRIVTSNNNQSFCIQKLEAEK